MKIVTPYLKRAAEPMKLRRAELAILGGSVRCTAYKLTTKLSMQVSQWYNQME